MAQRDLLKRYLDAGMAFTAMTKTRAEGIVRELVRAGEIQRDQVQSQVDELIERSRRNTDQLIAMVRKEVTSQLTDLGTTLREELRAMDRRRTGTVRTDTDNGPGREADTATAVKMAAKKTATKAAPARKAPSKRAPAKAAAPASDATRMDAAPAKTAPTRKSAPRKTAPAKKAVPAKEAPPAKKAAPATRTAPAAATKSPATKSAATKSAARKTPAKKSPARSLPAPDGATGSGSASS